MMRKGDGDKERIACYGMYHPDSSSLLPHFCCSRESDLDRLIVLSFSCGTHRWFPCLASSLQLPTQSQPEPRPLSLLYFPSWPILRITQLSPSLTQSLLTEFPHPTRTLCSSIMFALLTPPSKGLLNYEPPGLHAGAKDDHVVRVSVASLLLSLVFLVRLGCSVPFPRWSRGFERYLVFWVDSLRLRTRRR
jgi:hypothetical protein